MAETTTRNQTPQEITSDVFTRWQAEEIPAWRDGTYTPGEDQFAQMAAEAIEIDRAQRAESELKRALASLRTLNDLDDRVGTVQNPEYLRGQVELIAELIGGGSYEFADIVFATLGIDRV